MVMVGEGAASVMSEFAIVSVNTFCDVLIHCCKERCMRWPVIVVLGGTFVISRSGYRDASC